MMAFLVGLLKLAVSALTAVLVVFTTYRVFVKANTDFNEETALRDGNVAVGILVTALLLGSANIIQSALSPVMSLFLSETPAGPSVGRGALALYGLAHLVLAFFLAVSAMSFSLRVFGRLTRSYMRAGEELERGNVAVGLLLAGVVLVVGVYIGDGVRALSKALVPQPSFGQVQMMR